MATSPSKQITDEVTSVSALVPSDPHPLPFAPDLVIRSFRLRRASGDLLVYGAPHVPPGGDFARWYLNHDHEAMFLPEEQPAPMFVHDADAVAQARATFTRRHTLHEDFEVIPTPGHTPGATAYLWDSGEQRLLFTGDTIYLRGDEWVAAVLESSDRGAYLESLELIRELDFDVLVPWAASADGPYVARTDEADRRRRGNAIIDRIWSGGDS